MGKSRVLCCVFSRHVFQLPACVARVACRCAFERGTDDTRCQFYKNAYESLCPPDWVSVVALAGHASCAKQVVMFVNLLQFTSGPQYYIPIYMTSAVGLARGSSCVADADAASLCSCCRLTSGRSCASRVSGLASTEHGMQCEIVHSCDRRVISSCIISLDPGGAEVDM